MTGFSIARWLGAGAFVLALVCAGSGPRGDALAADHSTLLIVGDDADQESLPRGHPTFSRTLAALTNEMRNRGFTVYDENSVGIETRVRVHRTDAELISIAQRAPQPVSAVAVVNIGAQGRRGPSSIILLYLLISGHMIQVQTGKPLPNFVVPNEPSPMPLGCDRDCILDLTGKEAELIAPQVASVLARQLEDLSNGPR